MVVVVVMMVVMMMMMMMVLLQLLACIITHGVTKHSEGIASDAVPAEQEPFNAQKQY